VALPRFLASALPALSDRIAQEQYIHATFLGDTNETLVTSHRAFVFAFRRLDGRVVGLLVLSWRGGGRQEDNGEESRTGEEQSGHGGEAHEEPPCARCGQQDGRDGVGRQEGI